MIDIATLPGGVVQTFDRDGTLDDEDPRHDRRWRNDRRRRLRLPWQTVRSAIESGTDTDGDGVQDGGEAGINGVTVTLLDTGGNIVATQVTVGDGGYSFGNLLAGDYTVVVTPPAGFDPHLRSRRWQRQPGRRFPRRR